MYRCILYIIVNEMKTNPLKKRDLSPCGSLGNNKFSSHSGTEISPYIYVYTGCSLTHGPKYDIRYSDRKEKCFQE